MADPTSESRLDPVTGQDALPRSGPDAVVMVAASASALTATWLLIVTMTVLPARDPAGIPFWSAVTIGLLAYVALTAIYLRRGRRSPIVRAAAILASVAAVAVGGSWIVIMLTRRDGFEGYVVLIGAILAGHGAMVLLHVLMRGRSPFRASRTPF